MNSLNSFEFVNQFIYYLNLIILVTDTLWFLESSFLIDCETEIRGLCTVTRLLNR